MSSVNAKEVMRLREATGLGMMDCKAALVEAGGDFQAAIAILRVKSGTKAAKVASRIATEGIIICAANTDSIGHGIIAEINCETDFVAKDANFIAFAQITAQTILEHATTVTTIENAYNLTARDGETLASKKQDIVATLGENIFLRRFHILHSPVYYYLHGHKIGVLLSMIGGNVQLGKDIAMHIVASKPKCINSSQLDATIIETERAIYRKQASALDKPVAVIDKIVAGKIDKFIAENTLLDQHFIKNNDITIKQLLDTHHAQITDFIYYVVGEGIQKSDNNFADEVAAVMNSF